MLAERSDALVGAMLGKDYRVLERIGSGGMAVVYLVEHQTLRKQFAAKVLSSELASSLEARARFTQEAHAASQLDHENIVSISDFGVAVDHRPFFVMELLRGQTLDQRLLDGPMSIEEVIAVSVPVARALAHAHAEGIVHCDVKPENIFLVQRSQGRWGVKVVDFGIARTPLHPKLTHTKPKLGETLGSPLFMAPERIRGEADIDQRADIYSFGVLLYLMLCGRLPFYDENLQAVMQMHLSMPVPRPRMINPELSDALATVVERALAKRVSDRYPSMDALLIDLEAALPPGSDRLLIEAQSGTALGETPFASALTLARSDSQRRMQVGQLRSPSGQLLLRTMRVAPLPSPAEPPRLPPARSPTSRRAAVVITSALVSGMIGGIAWWQISTHRTRSHPPSASAPPPGQDNLVATAAHGEVPSAPAVAPAPPATPAPVSAPAASAAATEAGPVPPPASSASSSALASPPAVAPRSAIATAKADRATSAKKPIVRSKPIRREPPRPGKRVALASAPVPATPPHGAPAASLPEAEPVPAPAPAGSPAPTGTASTPGGSSATGAAAVPAASSETAEPIAAAEPPPPAVRSTAAASVASPAGSLDATPAIEMLDVKGSLSRSIVRRSVERTLGSLRACYRTAARAGNATPAIDLQLSFEIDENSLATHVTTGGNSFGSLASCAASVVGQVHTQEAPDVGTAQVSVVIRFRPTGSPGSQR